MRSARWMASPTSIGAADTTKVAAPIAESRLTLLSDDSPNSIRRGELRSTPRVVVTSAGSCDPGRARGCS